MGNGIFPKAIWQAVLITALGIVGGLVVNGLRQNALPLKGRIFVDDPASSDEKNGLHIGLEEAEGFFYSQAAVFIDTREGDAYAAGHIQGAKSLPWADFDQQHEKILEDVEKDAYIITYCDGARCNSSEHVAVALIERGYTSVYVLFDGWTQWQRNALPSEKGSSGF